MPEGESTPSPKLEQPSALFSKHGQTRSIALTDGRSKSIVKVKLHRMFDISGSTMGSFGEDLRMERLSRGIALEDITAVTKISHQHLLALEAGEFRQLPGGILSKGIVRGYATAVGLNQQDWTERFLRDSAASGRKIDDDQGWAEFARNVGKARMQRRDLLEMRLRRIALALLALVLISGAIPCWMHAANTGRAYSSHSAISN